MKKENFKQFNKAFRGIMARERKQENAAAFIEAAKRLCRKEGLVQYDASRREFFYECAGLFKIYECHGYNGKFYHIVYEF